MAPQLSGASATASGCQVFWPGAKQMSHGTEEHSADPLALFAVLFPDKMVHAVGEQLPGIGRPPSASWSLCATQLLFRNGPHRQRRRRTAGDDWRREA